MKKGDKNQRFFYNSFFPKNHRGTHVGVVLSFAIFITFLVFLYTVIEPSITTQKDKQFLLDYLERELVKQVSANLTTATLSVRGGEEYLYNCLVINYTLLGITSPLDLGLVIEDQNNTPISFEFQGENLVMGGFPDGKLFFKVYYSEEPLNNFPDPLGDCEYYVDEEEYTIGLMRIEKNIFKTKIIKLKDEYGEEYEILKDKLKIPVGSEFGFSFTSSNGTIITTGERKVLTSIYAKEIPIQYVDEEASINPGFMNIRVW